MIADIAYDTQLELPPMSGAGAEALRRHWPRFHVRNPLDPWGTDDYPEIYPTVIQQAADEEGDILLVAVDQQQTSGEHEKQLGCDLARYLADATSGTTKFPVVLSPTSQDPDRRLTEFCRSHQIPLLRGARTALSALAKVAAARHPVGDGTAPAAAGAPTLRGVNTEDSTLDVLAGLGVATPRVIRVGNGNSIVLKGSAAGVLHKTELGLVRAGLADPTTVRREAQRMLDWATGAGIDLELIVAEMIRGDLELIVGYKRDPVFGPTVLVGLGGVWTEFFDDIAVHVGTVDRAAALRLVEQSRAGRMITQSRSGPLYVEGMVTALCAVSTLGATNPDVIGIDINPLIVGTGHATAVDAVVEREHTLQPT